MLLIASHSRRSSGMHSPRHPAARLPLSGEGEQLSAVIDHDKAQSEAAEAEAERERRDTEAAIALAIALSKQLSQPDAASPHSPAAPRPASPVPRPAPPTATATAASEAGHEARPAPPSAARGFCSWSCSRQSWRLRESEAQEASVAEDSTLASMRREMEEAEEEERKQRLEVIKQTVAAVQAAEGRAAAHSRASSGRGERVATRRRESNRQPVVSSWLQRLERMRMRLETRATCLSELDGMFDWRRPKRLTTAKGTAVDEQHCRC